MMQPSKCWERDCVHYQGIKHFGNKAEAEIGQRYICKAFPKGIPHEISLGNNKHTKVHPKQRNKIVFEKKGG